MANSILGPSRNPRAMQPSGHNPLQMMQQFQQFRNNFRGNPQQMVQHMLQTGQINEAQLQQAMQTARQFQQFVK